MTPVCVVDATTKQATVEAVTVIPVCVGQQISLLTVSIRRD